MYARRAHSINPITQQTAFWIQRCQKNFDSPRSCSFTLKVCPDESYPPDNLLPRLVALAQHLDERVGPLSQ